MSINIYSLPSSQCISLFSVEDRGQRVTAHWISHKTAQQETETAFKVRLGSNKMKYSPHTYFDIEH